MMKSPRRVFLGLALALGAASAAHAGLVTGNADPLFGSPFTAPSLSYKANFSVYLPDALSASNFANVVADNIHVTGSVQLFETLNPGNVAGGTFDFRLATVSFDPSSHLLSDWSLYCVGTGDCTQNLSALDGSTLGQGNNFKFDWPSLTGGVRLTCFTPSTAATETSCEDGRTASVNGLGIDITNTSDDGKLKGTSVYGFTVDGNGRTVLSTRVFTPTNVNDVPEPASLALVLAGLLGAAAVRRRQA